MSKKIVIVEDNVALAEIFQTNLEVEGWEVFVAYDGIAGLYQIQNEEPDLVLLDLMVPSIAGDEVLKRMRQSDWGRDIPVLVNSNLNEEQAPDGVRALGIAGYIKKGALQHDEIVKLCQEVLDSPNHTLEGY